MFKFISEHPILTVILLLILLDGLSDIAAALRGCK